MDLLPNELVYMIFNYVDLSDLLKQCKLVCKKWNQLINLMKLDEVIINFNQRSKNSWYHTFRSINPKTIVFCRSDLDFFDFQTFKDHFVRLKYIKIDKIIQGFKIEQLNFYEKLEILEIQGVQILNENAKLELLNLQILKIHLNWPNQIILNAPKLLSLCCNNFEYLKLVDFNSINFIETSFEFKNLSLFINLKVLKFTHISKMNVDILKKLPKNLEQLHYHLNPTILNREQCIEFFDAIVLEQKSRSSKLHFKFYFNGIEIIRSFVEYDFDSSYLDYMHMEYYDQLEDSLVWKTSFDYGHLMDIYNQKLPDTFFSKFNNIQSILANKIKNSKHFIWFLKNCKFLSSLTLVKATTLDQTFYNELPSISKYLTIFHLNETFELECYEFIQQFNLLIDFTTNLNLPSNLILKIFGPRSQKHFRKLSLSTKKGFLEIKKYNVFIFELTFKGKFHNCVNYSELKKIIIHRDKRFF